MPITIRKGLTMIEIKKYFDIQLAAGIRICARIVSTDTKSLGFVWQIYEQNSGRVLAKRQFAVDAYNGFLGLFFEENSEFTIRFDDTEASLYSRDGDAYIAIKSPTITAEIALKGLTVGYF